MNFAFVFPGQGSQSVGMLAELAAEHPQVREVFEQASNALDVDLWELSQHGPEEQLALTQNTQPALLTAGYAVWRVWKDLGGPLPGWMAGHSLGEFTALVCAGALEFSDAVRLVRDRGAFMQEAVPVGAGGMAAVIGLDDDAVVAACRQFAGDEVLEAANYNAPGQVVVAGSKAAVDRLTAAAREIGAKRVLALPISIPSHCSLMLPAAEKLAARLAEVELRPPEIPVVHNVDAATADSPDAIVDKLVRQLSSPVRWVETAKHVSESGAQSFIESGPGKVLAGLIKRIDRGQASHTVDRPQAIASAIDALRP